jgi:hypothetical protein
MLEQNGVRIAAVSYDKQERLAAFAAKYGIRFPLLSDHDSAIIRKFGIFNQNMAPDLHSYGVPHPVEYLVAPDGIVVRKYFVTNYQHRVTGSAIALREFGTAARGAGVTLRNGPLTVKVGFPAAKAFAGQEVSFFADFTLEPGWHAYGSPLPDGYRPVEVVFEDPRVVRQSLELTAAETVTFAAPGEPLPVYSGSFRGVGSLLLKFPLEAGTIQLHGFIRFQACTDTVCEPPRTIEFELPLILGKFVAAERK